jgi:hypothetical protein
MPHNYNIPEGLGTERPFGRSVGASAFPWPARTRRDAPFLCQLATICIPSVELRAACGD